MKWYVKVLRQYADFGGRARRTEFWMFTLFSAIFSVVFAVIDPMAGLSLGQDPTQPGVLRTIYTLAVLVPSLAVTVRRLHDIDHSGWWVLVGLIPVVGWVILLVWSCTDGTPEPNEWGPNPKTASTPRGGPSAG